MENNYFNKFVKLVLVIAVAYFTSCREEDGLAYEYMPDMYRSPSIETYVDYGELRGQQGNDTLINTLTARQPVAGTVPRGFTPYPYENTVAGYDAAGQNFISPFSYTDESISKGKELYGMFCVHCHGKTGQGDGTLVEREKFPPIPTKFNEALTLPEGKMFHTITYGKGLMGSHASQLNQKERWQLIHYIRSEFMKKRPSQAADMGGIASINGNSGIALTGNLSSDLDLIFNFFDEDIDDYMASSPMSPALVLQGVIFKQASAKLKIDESKNTLDLIATKLMSPSHKALKILLGGHTHKGPSETVNVALSEKRANAVKEYLVNKGVDASRIQTKGYGYSRPLSTGSDKEARVKNRRTEISVIK